VTEVHGKKGAQFIGISTCTSSRKDLFLRNTLSESRRLFAPINSRFAKSYQSSSISILAVTWIIILHKLFGLYVSFTRSDGGHRIGPSKAPGYSTVGFRLSKDLHQFWRRTIFDTLRGFGPVGRIWRGFYMLAFSWPWRWRVPHANQWARHLIYLLLYLISRQVVQASPENLHAFRAPRVLTRVFRGGLETTSSHSIIISGVSHAPLDSSHARPAWLAATFMFQVLPLAPTMNP
jgi:hypothetical protein